MKYIVYPSVVKGSLVAPSSKSVAQRAVAIACIAEGLSWIYHSGFSQDVHAAIDVCKALGAVVEESHDVLQIKGGLKLPLKPLDCGESGLGIRMFSAVAALFNEEVVLTGSGSLLRRPMDVITESLNAIGVECSSSGGKIPVKVRGPVPGGKVFIDGSVSSQVLTGVLIAGPYAQKPLEIHVNNLRSRTYIEVTLEVMRSFGVRVAHDNFKVFHVPAGLKYAPANFVVEGDWSSGALLLVAGAIAGGIELSNLREDSVQPDRRILEVLKECGALVKHMSGNVVVEKKKLKPFLFDATHCPDLFPPLVALAAHCNGISAIEGVRRLHVKESDRGKALQQEFKKMGINIRIEQDTMFVEGGAVKAAVVHSHHDHRIAMACAVAALAGNGPLTILEPQAVDKSYPGFFSDLRKVGIKVVENKERE